MKGAHEFRYANQGSFVWTKLLDELAELIDSIKCCDDRLKGHWMDSVHWYKVENWLIRIIHANAGALLGVLDGVCYAVAQVFGQIHIDNTHVYSLLVQ